MRRIVASRTYWAALTPSRAASRSTRLQSASPNRTDANAGAAMDGPAISEEEHEVVLHEEQPVVGKQAVPKERVRLDKDTHVEEQQVSETVRKEQIDVDDQGRAGR